MTNVFSCDPEWFDKLLKEQPTAVVAKWNKADAAKTNEWLEKLQKLEDTGVPIFVCDGDSCQTITDKIGAKDSGDTIVFKGGKEVGRLAPSSDLQGSLDKVRDMVEPGVIHVTPKVVIEK